MIYKLLFYFGFVSVFTAAFEWTPLSPTLTEDVKPQLNPKSRKKCTKIFPCYIVLTDVTPLIGDTNRASYRFLRSLRKTECPNMCKKMYFRRRLKAGKNVFNVKTPSYTVKRLKHFETIGEDRLSPKSKLEYTKLKKPNLQEKLPERTEVSERVSYPNMFMTKAGVRYSFDEYVENKKTEISKLKQKKIELEKEKVKQQVIKEKEELQEKERIRKEKELKEQLRILSDQIHIKRKENYHRKEMRKRKQEYLKPGVSVRSGRLRKPNSLFDNDMFAFNSSDIEGFRKLSALQEKQRKVLAEMKLRENRAKRVNRVVEHTAAPKAPKVNIKVAESLFKSALAGKPDKQGGMSKTGLEIDNPEKEDGVKTLDMGENKAKKKRKLTKLSEEGDSESVKKKRKKCKIMKSDNVLIGDFPDTADVMKFLQQEMNKSGRKFQSIGSQSTIPSETTGAEDTSLAYPHARSLLKASKESEKEDVGKFGPDAGNLIKGVKYLDNAKQGEAVKFQLGSKQLMMAKCGEKIVFYSPVALQKQIDLLNSAKRKKTDSKGNAEEKVTIKTEPGVPVTSVATVSYVTPTLPMTKMPNSSAKTILYGMNAAKTSIQSKLPIMRTHLTNLLSPPMSNIGLVQTTNSVTSQMVLVNTGIGPSMYAAVSAPGAGMQSAIHQQTTSISTSPIAALTSLVSTASLPTAAVTLSSSVSKLRVSSTSASTISTVNASAPLPGAGSNMVQTFAILSNQTTPQNTFVSYAIVPATNAFIQLTPTVSTVAPTVSTVAPTVLTVAPTVSSVTPAVSTVAPTVSFVTPTVSTVAQSLPTSIVPSTTRPIKPHTPVPRPSVKMSTAASTQSKSTTAITGTTQSQSAANMKKGKFYLLKVDGKHILIPVPDASTPDAPMQTKAYLVNEAPGVTSANPKKSNLTPIPTQTVNVPLPEKTVNNTQTQRPGSTAVPVLKKVTSPPGQILRGPLLAQGHITKVPILKDYRSMIAPQSLQHKVVSVGTPVTAVPKPAVSSPYQIASTTPTPTQVLSYKIVTRCPAPGSGPESICKEGATHKTSTSLIPSTQIINRVVTEVPITVINNTKPGQASGVRAVTSLVTSTQTSKPPIVLAAHLHSSVGQTATTPARSVTHGSTLKFVDTQPVILSTLASPTGVRQVRVSSAESTRPVVTEAVTVYPPRTINNRVVKITSSRTDTPNVVRLNFTQASDSKEPIAVVTTSAISAKSLLTGATVTTMAASGTIKPVSVTYPSKFDSSTKVNGHEPKESETLPAQGLREKEKTTDGVIDLDGEKPGSLKNNEEKIESGKEDAKSAQPFAVNREERLRKLKELIKQKNAAVDQIRQNLSKASNGNVESKDEED